MRAFLLARIDGCLSSILTQIKNSLLAKSCVDRSNSMLQILLIRRKRNARASSSFEARSNPSSALIIRVKRVEAAELRYKRVHRGQDWTLYADFLELEVDGKKLDDCPRVQQPTR